MDNDIKNLFKEIKKEDKDIEIPDFKSMYTKKTNFKKSYYAYMGIAASFLIILGISVFNEKEALEITNETTVIFFPEDKSLTTESLIIDESSVYSWEAITESLITNFNE